MSSAADRSRAPSHDPDGFATALSAMRDLAIVELLYGAGLRVSECCGLEVPDVDIRRSTVTVLGKGAKVRRLPLGEPARDAVDAYVRVSRAALQPSAGAADALFLNAR